MEVSGGIVWMKSGKNLKSVIFGVVVPKWGDRCKNRKRWFMGVFLV